ncbi:MAG: hypothetical protein KF835_12025 [Xanthobacteraceae bacterium]|nr:hypothetical protein [Xanthobacteraceae bacterium]
MSAGFIWMNEFLSVRNAVESLGDEARKSIAERVYNKFAIAKFAEAEGLDLRKTFQTLAAIATAERHQALQDGAADERDPDWAAAALGESWAGAKVGVLSGMMEGQIVEEIEKSLTQLCDEQLTGEDKRRIEESTRAVRRPWWKFW